MTVARKPGHRGERAISRKPLRGECRAFSGVTWLTRVRFYPITLHTRLSGASGARHSPRPLKRGREVQGYNSGETRREIAEVCPGVIARSKATKQFILTLCGTMDCFANARNDELKLRRAASRRQRVLDQLDPVRGAEHDGLVVEIIGGMMQAGAVAVAAENKRTGPPLQHVGEILPAHQRRHLLNMAVAGDLLRHLDREIRLRGMVDHH